MTIGNSPSIAPLIPLFCYFVENWIMYFLKLLSNLQVYFYCPLQILFFLQRIFSLPPIDLCLFNLINDSRNKMLLCSLILSCHRWISAWTIWKLWIRGGFWQVVSCISQGRVHRGADWKSPPAFLHVGPSHFQFKLFPTMVNGNIFQSLLSRFFCCCSFPYNVFITSKHEITVHREC